MEEHLIISDIATRTGIEAHVLRYWEKELQLDIPRNELGHRYYLASHVDLFLRIHNLKETGYQLKAIRSIIEQEARGDESEGGKIILMPQPKPEVVKEDKLELFAKMIKNMVMEALTEYDGRRSGTDSEEISNRVIKQVDYLFRVQEEQTEEHFKKLDETIRECQRIRQEAALGRSRGFFGRKKRQG